MAILCGQSTLNAICRPHQTRISHACPWLHTVAPHHAEYTLLSGSPLLVDQLVSALDVLVLGLGLGLGTRGLGFESQRVNYCHSPFLKYFYCLGLKNALN